MNVGVDPDLSAGLDLFGFGVIDECLVNRLPGIPGNAPKELSFPDGH